MKINPHELTHAIEALARSKGIEPDRVMEAVEKAIEAATKKHLRSKEELVCRFDKETGEFEIFAVKEVMDPETIENPDLQITPEEAEEYIDDPLPGDVLEIERQVEDLGRIAAQAAKQVIYQKVRDAERENIYKEFEERVGEVIHGIVKRFERGDIIMDIGRTEAILPRSEQSRNERYTQGDRVRAVIREVLQESKGPQIVLSRTDPALLKKLFEMEVPEIYDATVEIRLAVREPGERAKIAVHSRAKDIDPVGACVGMKGSRVQAVIRELHGEKIDIIPYSDDVITMVTNALSPARVNRVEVSDSEEKRLHIYVDDDQLSLAIGRKGQNVRLASRLVGWRIDVLSEKDRVNQAKIRMAMIANAPRDLGRLPGVGASLAEKLLSAGYLTVTSVADATIAELETVEGIGPALAEKIQLASNLMLDEGYRESMYKVTEDGEVIEEVEEVVELAPGEEVPEGYEVVDEGDQEEEAGAQGTSTPLPAPEKAAPMSDLERARAVLEGAPLEEAAGGPPAGEEEKAARGGDVLTASLGEALSMRERDEESGAAGDLPGEEPEVPEGDAGDETDEPTQKGGAEEQGLDG